MCGIAGMIGDGWAQGQFETLFDSISHRGPDCSGVYQSGNFWLGMKRLHIRGKACPLPFYNGESVAAFNGQIYGAYDDEDARFTLACDLDKEISIVRDIPSARINGMYACVLSDPSGEDLRLTTDYQFIKPLFYRFGEEGAAFCSEFVPLTRLGSSSGIHSSALAELFTYGWYLGDQTYLSSIQKVGLSDLRLHNGKLTEVPKLAPYVAIPLDDPATSIRRRVRESVRQCLSGRGPFGLALSGGLDSSILAWELNDAGIEDLITISVVMADTGDGLRSLDALNLPTGGAWETWRHHTVVVDGSWDFIAAFKSSTCMFGHPTNMSSLPLFQLIAKAAAEAGVRVLLSGEGVDELFAGYSSYSSIMARGGVPGYYRHPPRLALVRHLFGGDVLATTQERFAERFGECLDLRYIERELRLVRLLLRTDVCLMSQSVEGRVPFLHNRIPDLALSIPWERHVTGQGKALMREAYATEIALRSRTTKTRFKVSDNVLRDLLADKAFTNRVVSAAGQVFGASATRRSLEVLATNDGFDSDICCLLLSLSFLVEEGIAR